jgi:hypothetical protein
MPAEGIPTKALIAIAIVFLALVVVQLRWGPDKDRNGAAQRPALSQMHIADDGSVEIGLAADMTQGDLEALMADRVRLLREGGERERRATALELATMADDPVGRDLLLQVSQPLGRQLRVALFDGLKDPDAVVVRNCRRALIGLWRIFPNDAAARRFADGLKAYEAHDMDGALSAFQDAESLSGFCPPDLCRMMAEAWLAKSPPDPAAAVVASQKALESEPQHFLALCTKARALGDLDRSGEAVSALEGALAICPSLPEARDLRARLAGGGPD